MLALLVSWLLLLAAAPRTVTGDCGGVLRAPRGVITTPNFPDPYPVPLHCRWVIEAPADQVVAVYFTQFYMREGLRAAEYAFFAGSVIMGKTDFGEISSEREPAYLVSNKPVLVLEFSMTSDPGNAHLRVREFFLDVYGFNVTYEVLNKSQPVRQDACIYHKCSYTGNCLASADLERYECSCFPEFYGAECQYSPSCGPHGQPENMCLNGGTCRHYIGSTVRTCECPTGFTGARCEKSESDPSENCLPLHCSHTCIHNEARCSCPDGFYLAEDKQTCVEEGRTKYWVYFRLYDRNLDLEHMDPATAAQLKSGVESALQALLKRRLYKVDNLTIVEFRNEGVVKCQFFGEKEDYQQVKMILEDTLQRGRIGKYAVNRTYIHVEWEPALTIQRLEVSEPLPVVSGTELSLACIVQGPEGLQVSWMKDGALLNVNTPYRSLWTATVPRNSRDQHTALLGFDETHTLDSGEFTCRVTEAGGATTSKSVTVTVQTAPQPRVTPLTATVARGNRLVLTCLSQDDVYANFGYNWLKNGKILGSSGGEVVEDLFPTGSRLVMRAARASARYSCLLASGAGSALQDCLVTVVPEPDSGDVPVPTCGPGERAGIRWNLAAVNTADLQRCPSGYNGIVSRRCSLVDGKEAVWEDPDFSKCLSAPFLAIKEKMETLRMGYQLSQVHEVLKELATWLEDGPRHAGEGEPVVELLEQIVNYQRQLPGLVAASLPNNTRLILDVASVLLESTTLVQRKALVLKIHELLLESGLLLGSYVDPGQPLSLQRPAFVLEVATFQPGKIHISKFPHSTTVWLDQLLELVWESKNSNSTMTAAVVFYRNITRFLQQVYLSKQDGDLQYQLHSQPLGLALSEGSRLLQRLDPPSGVRVRLPHVPFLPSSSVPAGTWNISCGISDFSKGEARFIPDSCQLRFAHNFSVCHCQSVGTYSVLLTAYSLAEGAHLEAGFDVVVGIGCSIAAFLSGLTLFTLAVLWRKIPGAVTSLKLQVCVAVISTYIIFLKSIHHSLSKEMYPHVVSLLQFFLLVALSLQLCMGLLVYVEFTPPLKSLHFPEAAVAAIGWVFPTIVVGATLAAQVLEGFALDSWWLILGSNYFYAYTTSAFLIVVLQVLLFLTVRAEIRHHQKASYHSYSLINTRKKLLNRSLVISISLIIVSISSILYINYRHRELYRYFFSGASVLLGFVILASYTFCSEKAYILCSSQASHVKEDEEKEEAIIRAGGNTFKSFLKPTEIEPDVARRELDWKDLDQLFSSRGGTVKYAPYEHPSSTLRRQQASVELSTTQPDLGAPATFRNPTLARPSPSNPLDLPASWSTTAV